MALQLEPLFARATAKHLDLLEGLVGGTLPADYREFLLRRNGGRLATPQPFSTGVPFRKADIVRVSQRDAVWCLLGLAPAGSVVRGPRGLMKGADKECSIQALLQTMLGSLPSAVLPIMDCVTHSVICLSLDPATAGGVYYWDTDWRSFWSREYYETKYQDLGCPDDQNTLNWVALTRIADSFTEFMELLEMQTLGANEMVATKSRSTGGFLRSDIVAEAG